MYCSAGGLYPFKCIINVKILRYLKFSVYRYEVDLQFLRIFAKTPKAETNPIKLFHGASYHLTIYQKTQYLVTIIFNDHNFTFWQSSLLSFSS